MRRRDLHHDALSGQSRSSGSGKQPADRADAMKTPVTTVIPRWTEAARAQYWSEEITSPPARVPRAHQVLTLMVDLMALTEPSQNRTLTPPG